ncbi:RRP15-like protein [Lepus europaeus]|uniref:RRP15-like protein n=1 Tax=Lepus europaeus TaxID=9983 RepID=UPI002B49F794|nr:RRP15-like protein [Lepus europaeus]
MAAAVANSRVSAGKKLKILLKKKKVKTIAKVIASELEEEVKDASGSGGPIGRCGSEKGHFSDVEAIDADNEDDVEPCDKENENAGKSCAGTNMAWADAMAKILNKKMPKTKPTILVKNKELEKEKEKLKQERLERRKQLGKRREWEMMCRVKPDVVKDKEAHLICSNLSLFISQNI